MTSVDHNRQLPRSLSAATAADRALCATFFFLPVAKSAMFLSFALALALFAGAGGFAAARRDWRALPWSLPALALAFLPLLSLAVHGEQALDYLGLAYYWPAAFIVFFAARAYDIRPWLRAFAAGVFVAFLHAQLTLTGLAGLPWQPSALANYILYSQFVALAIVVLSVLYRHEARRDLKILYLLAMALFFVALLSGKGRSGLLAVVVLLPFIVLNLFPRVGALKMGLACLLAALAVVMSPHVQIRIEAAVNDVRLMQQEVRNTSLGYRADMWHTAVDLVRENPVLGAGGAGFKARWHSTPRTGQAVEFVEPHNAYLFFASSYGLPGLAALLWLYAALLRTGWKQRATTGGGMTLAFGVICVVGSFTNTMFVGTASHMTMMLFIGLQGALLHEATEAGQ